MERKTKLIVSLDVARKKEFIRLIDTTKDLVNFYKVGLVPFTALGTEALTILTKRKKKIFFDLKFYDIPNTMITASHAAMRHGVSLIDFHLASNEAVLANVVGNIKKHAKKAKRRLPLLIGVTVLTSAYRTKATQREVLRLVRKAKKTGFHGAVLSGQEALSIRKKMGEKFVIITPGIRLAKTADDQKRVVTPKTVKGIADFIVVGRPVYQAKDKRKAITMINNELR